jgi:hypothetical protein
MLGALRDEGAFRVPLSKVELYAAIRRDARAGMSGRAMEKKYRVGRRTVAKALSSAWPEPRKELPPRASKLDPFKPAIDGMLKADLDAPRKQRHTITRIYRRLMDEHGMQDVSAAATLLSAPDRPTALHLLLEMAAQAGAVSGVPQLPTPLADLARGKGRTKLAEAARRLAALT